MFSPVHTVAPSLICVSHCNGPGLQETQAGLQGSHCAAGPLAASGPGWVRGRPARARRHGGDSSESAVTADGGERRSRYLLAALMIRVPYATLTVSVGHGVPADPHRHDDSESEPAAQPLRSARPTVLATGNLSLSAGPAGGPLTASASPRPTRA